jgi:hypothetical protein
MCGITGIVHAKAGASDARPVATEVIRAMTDGLAHRGPDADGFHQGSGVALGHRRLKVNSFLRAADAPKQWRHPLWLGSVIPGHADDPLHPDLRSEFPTESVLAFAAKAYEAPATESDLQRLSYQY